MKWNQIKNLRSKDVVQMQKMRSRSLSLKEEETNRMDYTDSIGNTSTTTV